MKKTLPLILSCSLFFPSLYAADKVANISMEVDVFNRVKESIGNTNLTVNGKHTNEMVNGAVGKALRFDGYSTFIAGNIADYSPKGSSTFTMWVAPETYPIVEHDENTKEKITLAGNLNKNTQQGWRFALDKTGKYSFECYSGGWSTIAEASDLLPCGEWSFLVGVNDTEDNKVRLYRNGNLVAEIKSLGPISNASNTLIIGKTTAQSSVDFSKDTFNGLIDDINVYDGVLSGNDLAATPENEADLSIPESRFANDLLRPKFHGMPAANWTNETHGMTYSDGKYHVFFQKNANGPFMSRLHWGHISSENLYDWTEEKIAIAPSESYDTKGCWSGAVFTDEEITGNLPAIIYTGVDYQRAYIIQATPTDETLLDWKKDRIIINGKPSGLSDDFRDPYFFRNGNDAYIIVGTSKNSIGATTLHKYNSTTKQWSNDGKIFFAGTSLAQHGKFWEMPNITPLENGKWLFTVTPQETSTGVHVLYWIGTINEDGTFKPDTDNYNELELISRDGYGLLSPTIYQKDGKTIMMGIVPDKLPTSENCELGWAHLYSFPRELSLDEKGNLIQQPYSGLTELRKDGVEVKNLSLDGVKDIEGVSGRQVEIKGVFTVGSNPFGMQLFKNGKGSATLTYTPEKNNIEVNFNKLSRKNNDALVYGGTYKCELPEKPEPGSDMTIDVWVDGSIMDIFVNNRWATSIRVFPTDTDADGLAVFSTNGPVTLKSLNAYNLASSASTGGEGNTNGVEEIITGDSNPEIVNVYNINGILIKRNVNAANATEGLPKGIYVIGGKKVAI